ncbi:MAG: imidazole glycerol phosphate synthase subunit HisH [bacterium]
MTTVIMDYGMGNLRSVQKGIEETGHEAQISGDPTTVQQADVLIVPGVGAFDRAVENIKENDLWSVTLKHLANSNPYLGICLGFQLLFEGSQEGTREGFGHFSGQCRRFRDVSPIPHMGWNEVEWVNNGLRYDPQRSDSPCYYFVHSYFPEPENETIAAGWTDYGSSFCSAVAQDSILGVQFHPEKSQYAGLNLLSTYLKQYT